MVLKFWKNKRFRILSIIIIFTLSSYAWTTPVAAGRGTEDTWAIYWYLCGSDLETDAGCASADLEELARVDLPENISVIIQTGGAIEWHNGIDPEVSSRYLYNSDGFTLVDEQPLANMGDAETLEDFLRFCNEEYPADRQAVIFWNHGGGSVAGVAFDELHGFDSLTLQEIGEAFAAAETANGKKYELVGFDACLMATIDTAAALGDYADWFVASQEIEPGIGWAYDVFFQDLADNPGMNGAELGKAICDSYYAACEEIGQSDIVTLSVIDLSQIAPLVNAYDAMGTEALAGAGMSPTYINAFGRAARSAENYGGNNASEGYANMVDLGSLTTQAGEALLPVTSEALLSALENAVYYQVQGYYRQQASGLSCYFNYNGDYENYMGFADEGISPAFAYYFDYALSGAVSDEMIEYLSAAAPVYSEEEILPQTIETPDAAELEDFPVSVIDEQYVELSLGSELADSLAGVYFHLAYIDIESNIAVFLGLDNDLDANWESGVFQDNFRGVWGSIDEQLVYMEISEETADYQLYAVPVLCNGEEYTMIVSYIYSTENYQILGLRRGIDEYGMADKNIRPLIPGDILEPLLYAMDLDSDDEMQPFAGDAIIITQNTEFMETDLGDGDFMFVFEMKDMQNNSYLSEAVMIAVENGEIRISKE